MQNQPRISRVNKYIHLYSPYSQNPLRRCYFKSRASMKTHTLHREEIGEGPRCVSLFQAVSTKLQSTNQVVMDQVAKGHEPEVDCLSHRSSQKAEGALH